MLGGKIDKRLRGSTSSRVVWPRLSRRQGMVLGGGLAGLLVIALLVWALWPEPEAEPRPREYTDATACLLTDADGVAGAGAAPVWAGMQQASRETSGQVRYLAVGGEQTVENARTFVGTLILGRCTVIVAAPGIADGAVRAVAGDHLNQQFMVVDGDAPEGPNVVLVGVGEVAATLRDRLSTQN
ncbi:hypothetical protein [Winogradskya humida]|uniref:hypothetical protein n=1 Tax=Winogradskya humida TaxID=113566 RepID=UPI001943A94A|nr:hypothetical protein [Actinoplanes humidus]